MTARWLLKGIIKSRQNLRLALRDERGALAVEFAITAPIFLIFVLGVIDIGRVFWVKNIMQYSVEQSARYAMVNPEVSQADLEAYAEGTADPMFTGITFTADSPGTDVVGGISYRTIIADYNFDYLIPLVSITDVPLTSTSRIPVNPS